MRNVGTCRVSALLLSVLWILDSRPYGACCKGSSRLKVAVANLPEVPRLSHETGLNIGQTTLKLMKFESTTLGLFSCWEYPAFRSKSSVAWVIERLLGSLCLGF